MRKLGLKSVLYVAFPGRAVFQPALMKAEDGPRIPTRLPVPSMRRARVFQPASPSHYFVSPWRAYSNPPPTSMRAARYPNPRPTSMRAARYPNPRPNPLASLPHCFIFPPCPHTRLHTLQSSSPSCPFLGRSPFRLCPRQSAWPGRQIRGVDMQSIPPTTLAFVKPLLPSQSPLSALAIDAALSVRSRDRSQDARAGRLPGAEPQVLSGGRDQVSAARRPREQGPPTHQPCVLHHTARTHPRASSPSVGTIRGHSGRQDLRCPGSHPRYVVALPLPSLSAKESRSQRLLRLTRSRRSPQPPHADPLQQGQGNHTAATPAPTPLSPSSPPYPSPSPLLPARCLAHSTEPAA